VLSVIAEKYYQAILISNNYSKYLCISTNAFQKFVSRDDFHLYEIYKNTTIGFKMSYENVLFLFVKNEDQWDKH
jgi:hypothetical protein